MTVSRVINNVGNVSDHARAQVLKAISKLDYSPNRAARSLAGGELVRIALMFDNPSASYLSEFLMGALEEATKRDIHLEVRRCEDALGAAQLVRKLAAGGIGGFILPPPLCDDVSLLDLIEELDAIAVAVGPGQASGSRLAVMIDDFQAAYDMTRHILDLGHRRIGFIIGNPEQAASERRLMGYLAALKEAGIERHDELIVQGRFSYQSGLAASDQLLSLTERPTAIFASNDDMAAATISVAHRRSLEVPGDLTVCGFDDTAIASTVWPELTTVRQPIREMTAWAVTAITRNMSSKKFGTVPASGQTFLPYSLVKRDSDAAPA